MNDFLNPKSMLTPGMAGALVMFLSNAICFQFPEIAPRWAALLLSFVLGGGVIAAAQLKYFAAAGFWLINSLIIFAVAAGSAGVASKTTAQMARHTTVMFANVLIPSVSAQAPTASAQAPTKADLEAQLQATNARLAAQQQQLADAQQQVATAAAEAKQAQEQRQALEAQRAQEAEKATQAPAHRALVADLNQDQRRRRQAPRPQPRLHIDALLIADYETASRDQRSEFGGASSVVHIRSCAARR